MNLIDQQYTRRPFYGSRRMKDHLLLAGHVVNRKRLQRLMRLMGEEALTFGKPGIFNTDQGSQFTSLSFTGRLSKEQIKISMDGRGRALDNVFVERLWRSVKYEDIYIKDYQTVPELYFGLDQYFRFYNHERSHQSLGGKTPAMIYHNCGYLQTA